MTLKGLMLRFRTVLFDLDGTLVDAFTTIHRAYCHTLPLFGVPAPSAEEVRRSVGGGLEHAMSLFLPPHLVAEACRVHVAYTEKILLEDPVLYDGAMELVGVLHAQGREHLGSRALGAAGFGEPCGAFGDDGRDVVPGLDVIDVGWFAPQPLLRRKWGTRGKPTNINNVE